MTKDQIKQKIRDKEKMVRTAVDLAKANGVNFGDTTPSFRPKSKKEKERFNIVICTNTRIDTEGIAIIDQHFNVLDNFDEISLANSFIDFFNALNVNAKVNRVERDHI